MLRFLDEFEKREAKNKTDPHCKACLAKLQAAGTPLRCTRCRGWFAEDAFAKTVLHQKLQNRLCRQCAKPWTGTCSVCGIEKQAEDFTQEERKHECSRQICKECKEGIVCSLCRAPRGSSSFDKSERSKPPGTRLCNACLTRTCANCQNPKRRRCFSRAQWSATSATWVCELCDRKRCFVCNAEKRYKDFSNSAWERPHGDVNLVCRQCSVDKRKQGHWTCRTKGCLKQLPLEYFSIAISRSGPRVQGNSRRCNECIQRQDELERAMNRRSLEHVQKRRRT